MATTLKQARSRLQNKLNSFGTGTPFQPDELNDNIRSGVRMVAYEGEISLVQPALYLQKTLTISGDTSTVAGGAVVKPSNYFKFVWARMNGRRCRLITPEEIDDVFYNSNLAPSSINKYIMEATGTYFSVWGDGSESTMDFHYLGMIESSFGTDDSNSPLTDVGTDLAIDWAFALSLESKGLNPQLSTQVFSRVASILKGKSGITAQAG